MTKTKDTWVMVADSGLARLFIADEHVTGLIPAELPELSVEVHHHARDLKSDRPGRSFSSSGGGARHAIEPHHDYHKLEKHNFAAAVAHALNRAYASGEFNQLVLVVPPRTLGELRKMLGDSVQARMQVIAKDLTKAAVDQLWTEVASLVRVAHLTQ
jgi:protein required for attachment to host cells